MADQQPNPFDQLAEGAQPHDDNPFNGVGDELASPTSATGAFARSALRSVIPTLASIPGAAAGAETGATIGAFGGPFAEFTVPGGAILGGITGALLSSTAASSAQHYALSRLPDSWTEAIGMSDRQERLDEAQHGTAAFLGGLAPYAVTMNPFGAASRALPANATALQRIMAHPATARVFGGGIMGGLELGQEAASPDPISWQHVAIATGAGVVFNRPNRIGERIGEWGARPARRLLGVPSPEPAEAPAPAAQAPAAAPEAPPELQPTAAPRPGIRPDLFTPTVAEAADAKVMGPGITEEVFHGTHEINPQAGMAAQEIRRTEAAVLGPAPQPDVRAVAQRMDPDIFARYEALSGQREDFRAWLDAVDPGDTVVRAHLAAVDNELAGLEPQVAAAYRRAGEATGAPPIEPPAAEAAPGTPERSIDAQKRAIADDVAQQLIKAGRPEAEARAAGELIAARYEARAAMFRGALGTAEEMYDRDAAEILGAGQKSTQYPIRKPRRVNEKALSLFQFLAHRGGLAPQADLQAILDRNPFLPGFGALIREGGMSLDRAREAAVEGGYLHDQGDIEGRVAQTDTNSLLAAIEEEARGNKKYREGYLPPEAAANVEPEGPRPLPPASAEEKPSELMSEEDHDALELLQRRRRNLIAEREAMGQMELPGTERSAAQTAAARGEMLRSEVAQDEAGPLFAPRDEGEKELFQRDEAPAFYSAVARAVDNAKQAKASPDQWLAMIRNTAGVKAEELEWLGLADWLKEQDGPVTKQQIADYVRANSIQVQEVARGARPPPTADELAELRELERRFAGGDATLKLDDADRLAELRMRQAQYPQVAAPGKFERWTLPGGENYRELVLTLPGQVEPYKPDDVHFTEEGGGTAVAWVRFNDRVIDGKRTLFLEEVQSKRHQEGRKRGYKSESVEHEATAAINGLDAVLSEAHAVVGGPVRFSAPVLAQALREEGTPAALALAERVDAAQGRYNDAIVARGQQSSAVPDAPFKTSWPELSLKRMIRYAAEHGYEQIAWTPGEVQASRYDLSKQVGRIRYVGDVLDAWDTAGKKAFSKVGVKPEELPDYIGKESAEKLLSQEPKNIERLPYVRREDLTVEPTEHQYIVRNKDGREVKIGKGTVASEPEALEYAERYFNKRADEINRNRELEGERIGPTRELSGLDLKVGGEGMLKFYDDMLPAAANKLVKKYGAKVGQSGFEKDGGIGEWRYKGPTLTPDQIVDAGRTHYRGTVQVAQQLRDIAAQVQRGVPMADAVERFGSYHAAEALGGELVPLKQQVPVHTLPITDSLRDAALSEGFPLFQGARGKIRLMEGMRPVITLMRDADASTFIHETGHEWLEQMMKDAQHELAPDQLKQDAATALKWMGVTRAQDIGRRQHEKFARGFEQYMREGVAPSAGLANVFARFANWLKQIYQTLKGLGAPISDDIRRVFDRMLVAEPHPAVVATERAPAPSLADIHEADAAEALPHEAEPMADRIAAERLRAYDDHPELAHEHEAWLAAKAEHEATGPEPGAGAEPPVEPAGAGAAEAGSGGAGTGQVHGAGGGAGAEPAGGGVREPDGAERAGGAGVAGQGAGLSPAGERSRGREESGALSLAATPASQFERGDERVTDLAGNIRVENLTDFADIAQAIHDSAERNADFLSARGAMTKGQMMDLADAMGLDPSEINEAKLANLLGGTANLAPRILAARKLVVDSAAIVADAMKRAATGTDEDVAALAVAIARHDLIQGALSGATAEWGRAGNAFHSLQEGWAKAEAVNDFLKANTGRTLFQLKQIAKLGTQLDTPGKVSKYLRDAQKRSFGGMILEYWINGLISGPATHTTYAIGNAILAAEKAGPETAAAALIGNLRKAMGREGETVRLGEVGAQFRAAGRALPAAIEAGMEGLRSGMTTLLPGETARPLMPFSGDTSLVLARSETNAPVSWAEVGADLFSTVRSVRDAFMSGAALIAAGGEPGAPLIGWQYSPLGQIPDVAIRGVRVLPGLVPGGTMFRAPGRLIAAIHSFFRMMNYSMEKARLAYRTAADEGLTGTAFDARVGDLWQNPTDAIMEQARDVSTQLTLMGQGSEFVRKVSALTNHRFKVPALGEVPLLKFIDPFVHIAANVIDQSIVQRTPLGILSSELRADLMGHNGNVAQDTAMARMLVGTVLSIGFGGLAAQGLATGSGPKDPKEAAMWRLAGNQAHSVRIGDRWIDVHRLGPMGMLMGIAADLYDVQHQLSQEEFTKAAAHLHHAIVQNVLDESFMRGPADLIQAVEDPGRYGDAYVRNMLASFVPFSVGMAQMARASDPYSRQTRTVVDAMMAKVPGMSQELFPRRDIWGEPMANLQALGIQGLSALWVKQINDDPVNKALYDLGIFPAQVPRKIRNVELTEQEYDDFAKAAGRLAKMRLDVIVRAPDWRTWPNHAKASVIQEVMKQSRETARGMMMARYPRIPHEATAAKLKKVQD